VKLLPVILASLLVGLAGGCRTAEPPPPPVVRSLVARVYLEALPQEQGIAATLPVSGVRLTIDPRAVLTECDVAGAALEPAEYGTALQFTYTQPAARDLYRKTAGMQGRRLVLTLNGAAMAAQRIGDPVTAGTLLFYPEVRGEQLPAMLADIRSTTAAVQAKLVHKK
jgi:hypothetical protein